jgi:hypothetical protein
MVQNTDPIVLSKQSIELDTPWVTEPSVDSPNMGNAYSFRRGWNNKYLRRRD